MKKIIALALSAVMAFSLVSCGAEAEYPSKAITNIVPVSAGGSTDLYNRLIGNYIEPYLGQTFVVENIEGGAQVIGVTAIKDAEPDGYTIGVGWGASFGMRPFIMDVTYELEDFQFICGVMEQKVAIIVRGDSEWETLDDLLNALAEDPTINYAAGNAGSFQYAMAAHLMSQVDVSSNMIPHDGDSGGITSLQNGTVDWISCEPTSAVSAIRSGDLKILACFGEERDPAYPDVPCTGELGYNAELVHSMTLVCGADVPAEYVETLRDAIKQTLEDPGFIEQCETAGYAISYKTAEECETEVQNMIDIIEPLVESGLFS